MRFLTNVPWKSCSKTLDLLSFGPGSEWQIQYDYTQNFTVVMAECAAKGIAVDGVLFYLPEVYEIPPRLFQVSVPIIALLSDWNLNFTATWLAVDHFDYVLMDERGSQLLQSLGYSHVREFNMYGLHLGSVKIPPAKNVEKPIDIAFVGNVSPCVQKERGRWLRRVLRLRDRYTVRMETHLYGDEYYELMHQAKVMFNHSIRGEVNMRVFETLGAGELVFLEASNREISQFLAAGQCVLYEDSAMEKILEELLQDPKRMAAMVSASQAKREKWSAEARWEGLGDILARIISTESSVRRPITVVDLMNFGLTATRRYSPQYNLFCEIDSLIGSTMTSERISLVMGRFVFQDGLTSQAFQIMDTLYRALESTGNLSIWNLIHYALCLETASHEFWHRESELWLQLLSIIQNGILLPSSGNLFYRMPFARHHDLQQVLWNEKIPHTFEDVPNLARYLQHWALHRLGEISMMHGEYSQALSSLRNSAKLYSQHAPTWIRIAECLPSTDAEHLQALERAFDIDPMNPHVGVQLLAGRIAQGRIDDARSLAWELEGLLDLQFKVYPASPEQERKLRDEFALLILN